MARALKFPGLQPKFEAALQIVLESKPLSGGDIQSTLASRSHEFNLSKEEIAELRKNFANYIARSKEADFIRSGGPWAGYQLVRAPGGVPASLQSGTPTPVDQQPRRPSESAMHFVATFALSLHFGARLKSLPITVDPITWGNADMLMLRGNSSRQRLEDSNLDAEILRLADSSPECILSSVELKYGLERNRRSWFQAVAEAAANSRWANESLLVHISSEDHSAPIDEEVVSLARSAEIGILEVSLSSAENRRMLDLRVLVAAPQRPFLRLNELSGNRVGLLKEAHALLRTWSDLVVTFLDEDGASAKLLRLLRQAFDNLRRQSGFVGPRGLTEGFAPFATEKRVANLYLAALDTATTSTDAASDFAGALPSLREAMGVLSKNEYDSFSRDLEALQVFVEPVRASRVRPG